MSTPSIREHIPRVWYNIVAMLRKRGHDITQVNTEVPLEVLYHQYDRLVNNGSSDTSLDICIQGERKCCVKFLVSTQFKRDKNDYGGMRYYSKFLTKTKYLSEDDDIIYVYLCEDVDLTRCYAIETEDPRVSVFPYKRILTDITEHSLVPLHERVDETRKKQLRSEWMLQSLSQLPALQHSDPICRFYRFRNGDVIQITRNTVNGPHVVYRVVSV